jgi:hypothetical protein
MPFTPDDALDLLFPEELVPQHVKDELPLELHVRIDGTHPLLLAPLFPTFSLFLILF